MPQDLSRYSRDEVLNSAEVYVFKISDPQADTSALEAGIDRMVYKLYDLTAEEIAIVEESLRR